MGSIDSNDGLGIKLFQLRAFVAVAEHKRFGEAALQIGLTQSSISHAIAALEEELGVQLLVRGRSGAMLTPIGEQLVADAREVLKLLQLMAQKARMSRGLSGGQVRLASLRSIATYVLPNMMATFHQQFPDIKLTLTQYFYNGEIQQALRSGAADIGFLELPLSDQFATSELLIDEYVVLLPAKAQIASLSWNQLSQYAIIMPAPNYEGSHTLQQHLKDYAPSLNIAYEINEDSIQVAMVQQGLGVAILPHLAALPIPPDLRALPLPVPLRRRLGAAMLIKELHPPATFAFWELVAITR